MILDIAGNISNIGENTIVVNANNGDVHYVKGFFYLPGFESGEASICEVIRIIEETGKIPFAMMRGAYIYVIRKEESFIAFPCNSMMRVLYISEFCCSDSFIELLSFFKDNGYECSYNPQSVCENYVLGHVFFDKTLINEAYMLKNTDFLVISECGIQICDKEIGEIDEKEGITDPYKFYSELAIAMNNRKVALALSGGYDSRLIMSQLYDKSKMTIVHAANCETRDYKQAIEVAKSVNMEIVRIKVNKDVVTETSLLNEIIALDGMCAAPFEQAIYINNIEKKLADMHIDLHLTGDGGVRHKDWGWMQDFPFYHKKRTDLKRLFELRIGYSINAQFVGQSIEKPYKQLSEYFVENMRFCVRKLATQSYDILGHFVTGNFKNNMQNGGMKKLDVYAPLLEYDYVRYAYRLPRHKRYFCNYMREMITNANKNMARIPTDYKTTASSEPMYKLRDFFFQLGQYYIKALRVLKRKLRIKEKSELNYDFELGSEIRQLDTSKEAVVWAKEKKILSEEAEVIKLSDVNLQRIIYLYLMHKYYGIE